MNTDSWNYTLGKVIDPTEFKNGNKFDAKALEMVETQLGSKWLCNRSQNQFSKNYLALLGLRVSKFRLLVGNRPQRFQFWTCFCSTAAANCSIRPLLNFPYKNPFKMGPPSWTLRTSTNLDEIWHTSSSQRTSQRIKLPGESETKV